MKTDARKEAFRNIDIYPVISSEFCAGRDAVDVLKAVADGGAKIVQMREKKVPDKEKYILAEKFRELTSRYAMLLIIDDRVDVALSVDADGVHLGQDDFPMEAARRIAPELLIGISTHSRGEALNAQNAGADYINIGPIFPTATKQVSCGALGTGIISELSPYINIPFTVMGGIKGKHIPELISLGARRIAMVTEISEARDITGKVKELRSFFQNT